MRRAQIAAVVAGLCLGVSSALAAEFPKSQGYVSDFADLLNAEEERELAKELKDLDAKTTVEIAVVTVPSLQGETVESYTVGLANAWGVSKKGKDNGVVILIAPMERKTRIEVGRGLASTLPDPLTRQIIDRQMLPKFKTQQMSVGIIDGTHRVMQVVNSSHVPASPPIGAIFLGSVGLVFLIWFGVSLWQNLQTRQENRRQVNSFRARMIGLKRAQEKSMKTLERLISERPSANWKDFQATSQYRNFPEWEQSWEALAREAETAIWGAEILEERVRWARWSIADFEILFQGIEERSQKISRAQAQCPDILTVVEREYSEQKQQSSHVGVSDSTRQLVKSLSEAIASLKDAMAQEPHLIDWLQVHAALERVEQRLKRSAEQMAYEITLAEKARQQGPELIKTLPDRLEKLRGNAKTSQQNAELEALERSYGAAAHQLATAVQDPFSAYLLLLSVSNACDMMHAGRSVTAMSSSDGSVSSATVLPTPVYDAGASASPASSAGGGFDGGGASGSW